MTGGCFKRNENGRALLYLSQLAEATPPREEGALDAREMPGFCPEANDPDETEARHLDYLERNLHLTSPQYFNELFEEEKSHLKRKERSP